VVATRRDPLVEVLHGVPVADPYRWLEDSDSPEVRAWDEAQTAETRALLDALPVLPALRARAKELLSVGYVGAPVSRAIAAGGRRYFHTRREGAQEQGVLCVRDGVGGADRVLIDPAPMAADGTTTIDWWAVSRDGALVAWGLSEAGSEDSTLRVRDVATGQDLPDRIPHTRHASVAWLPDGKTFFYTRYPAPGDVPPGDEQYFCRVFRHTLGDDPAKDPLVFGESYGKLDVPAVVVAPGGRWLVVRVHMGWQKSELWAKDLATAGAPWIAIARGPEALYEPIPLDDVLYVMTNEGAPRYRLYAVDWTSPARDRWREVIAENGDVLADVTVVGGQKRVLIALYLHEATARIERLTPEGKALGPVPLPVLGSAGVQGAHDASEAFVELTSFATPWQVLRVDVATGATTVWDKVEAGPGLPAVRVSMLHATSKDGTSVPMFVVERADANRTGDAAAVLYGYGGFNVVQSPAFSARALMTVERGGVWAVALLRGGGEMGEDWHRAGMLGSKQNVFDDLYACAETLVREKVTTHARLGIVGGSNGGLLTATAITQRPELFRAALSLVPLADMLRYHRYRIGALWTAEYGDPDDPAAFAWLHAYSPVHHVREGVRYPAVLFATAESDSRVDPMHARKMAAAMQAAQAAKDHPVLLRVEARAGHGAGKPVAKLVDELADEMAFLFAQLAM
jgi:prolyl oligopeptidase